jgi:hypothetical protein
MPDIDGISREGVEMIINFFILAGIEYIHYIKKLLLMKKIIFLLLFISMQLAALATLPPLISSPKASDVLLPIGFTGQKISLQELADINLKDFEKLSGQKMNLFGRLSFKMAQRELKQSISEDGTINNKKLQKLALKMYEGDTGFHVGGFFLGFLVGLIGVLIAYLINDDKKRNRVKWSWIGFGAWVLLYVLVILPLLV